MTNLVLIRHGVTEWNKSGRYCGHRDIGLSREGRSQAAKLGRKLNAAKFDKIYCSDRKRALQTARIVFGRADFVKVAGLKEIDFGGLEGMRHKEILDKYGKVYKNWLKNPYKNNIPKTETVSRFKNRIDKAIKKIIRSNPGKTVAIVCHGGVISAFVNSALRTKSFWKYVPSATGVTIVECGAVRRKLKSFNDTHHLREVQ